MKIKYRTPWKLDKRHTSKKRMIQMTLTMASIVQDDFMYINISPNKTKLLIKAIIISSSHKYVFTFVCVCVCFCLCVCVCV